MILVHPNLDQPNMGSGAVVVTDNDQALAVELARELAMAYWDARFELEPESWTPEEAIAAGQNVSGDPVILVEAADCCGGGAAGDSVATLRALLEAEENVEASRGEKPELLSLVPVVDPTAAQVCHEAGVGDAVTLRLGHQQDPRWGNPIDVTGQVVALGDGRFHYDGGIFDGTEGNMGPTAVLAIGTIRVLIMTYATYDWRDEQFRAMKLDPTKAKFIVAKNPMNYRLAYGDLAKAIYILDTPGPTPVTMRNVQFTRLKRPYFPLDETIKGLNPTILV